MHYAVAHCITSYPVGRVVRTHIPHACGEEAKRMRPIYENGWLICQGWARSSSIPRGPRREPQLRAVRWSSFRWTLCFQQSPLGNEPGGEIAPQRNDQFARQGDDGDTPDPAARAGRLLA